MAPRSKKKAATTKTASRSGSAANKAPAAKKKSAAKKKAASRKKAPASKPPADAKQASPESEPEQPDAPADEEAPDAPESGTPARQRPAKGRLVNRSEIAELYGVSLPTVTSWVKRGCPYVRAGNRGKEWQFNTAAVAEWREQQAYANAVGNSGDWDLEEARRRREAAEAALKEIELAKARGEVVEIEAVADIVGDDYSRVRARLIAIPPKLAPLVHRAESVAEIREYLDDGVREALAELSRSVAGEFADEDPGDEGEAAEAAAAAEGQ